MSEERDGERVLVLATINKRAGVAANVTLGSPESHQVGVWVSEEAILPLIDDVAAENAALRIAVGRAREVAERMATQGFAITPHGIEAEAARLRATCDFALAPGRGAVIEADMANWSAKIGRQKERLRQQDLTIRGLRGTVAALGQQVKDLLPLIRAADETLLSIESGLVAEVTDDHVTRLRQAVKSAQAKVAQRQRTRKASSDEEGAGQTAILTWENSD